MHFSPTKLRSFEPFVFLDFADKTHSSVVVGARVDSSGAVAVVVVVVRFCLKMQPAMDTGARGGRTGGL